MYRCSHRRKITQKQRQRSSLLIGGRNCFYWVPHLRFSAWKRINIWKNAWRNGVFRKMDEWFCVMCTGWKSSISQNICYSNHPFLQIIVGPNDLPVRHSIRSPSKQRWPLPSLLSDSYSMGAVHYTMDIFSQTAKKRWHLTNTGSCYTLYVHS